MGSEFHEESFQERLALAKKTGLPYLSKQPPAGKEERSGKNDFSGLRSSLFFRGKSLWRIGLGLDSRISVKSAAQ